QGALANLGHEVARGAIANILKEHGLEPAPARSRKTTWKEFLSRHWEVMVAADFFTVEVWTRSGLTRFIVLFLIDLWTRRVEIAGIATKADGIWIGQVARNLCDDEDGFLTAASRHARSPPHALALPPGRAIAPGTFQHRASGSGGRGRRAEPSR
ncbi:MAG: hypothetical protein NT090_05825, partial [Acidobacteria bacterium]|nr:hypothetical protein [Acidobacteriota bacterium]